MGPLWGKVKHIKPFSALLKDYQIWSSLFPSPSSSSSRIASTFAHFWLISINLHICISRSLDQIDALLRQSSVHYSSRVSVTRLLYSSFEDSTRVSVTLVKYTKLWIQYYIDSRVSVTAMWFSSSIDTLGLLKVKLRNSGGKLSWVL